MQIRCGEKDRESTTMEANLCDVNHLDGDVVLPPRKRLLAGLKLQSPDTADAGTSTSLHLSLVAPSSSSTSASTPPPSPASTCEFRARLASLLRGGLTPDEIVAASKSAAYAARTAAEDARAAAEEKAAEAARAMAAAKSALDLVASLSEERRQPRKSKMKKHVPVQLLYKKHRPVENCKKDEEIARKLHRAINSSQRLVTKSSPGSDSKDRKHKRPKSSIGPEKSGDSSGEGMVSERNGSNGHAAVRVDF